MNVFFPGHRPRVTLKKRLFSLFPAPANLHHVGAQGWITSFFISRIAKLGGEHGVENGSKNDVENHDTLKLTAREARQRDANRLIARIPAIMMERVGAKTGDVVLIKGRKETPAIAWPGYPQDLDEWIRIDAVTRENAGVAEGENVLVSKPTVSTARKVTLEPQAKIKGDHSFERFVARKLISTPVVNETRVSVTFGLDRNIMLRVVETEPPGVVVIRPGTQVTIQNMEPVDGGKTSLNRQQLSDFLGLGTKFRIDDIASLMDCNRHALIMQIIEWSKNIHLEVDGDYLIIDSQEREKLRGLLDDATSMNEKNV